MFSSNRALKEAHPEEPWLWKKSWAKGRIRSSSIVVIMSIFFTGVWTAFCLPLFHAFFNDKIIQQGNGGEDRLLWWLVVLFMITNGCLIVWTVRIVARWWRCGPAVFEMASVPGVIGGQLAGVVYCPKKLRPHDGIRVKLICFLREHTRNSDTDPLDVLWENEQIIGRDILEDDPNRTGIPVLFQIPYECPSTTMEDETEMVFWQLEVSAELAGAKYQVQFAVPVFETPQSDPDFKIDKSLIEPYLAPEDDERDLHEAGVRRTTSLNGDAQQFLFPMGRQLKGAFAFGFMGVLFLVVSVGVWFWIEFWFVALVFSVPFGLAGLFGVVAGFELAFYKSTVEASPRGLAITGGLFGRGQRRWINAEEVVKFQKTSNYKEEASDFQESKKKYYDLIVVCQNGQKITAAKRILGNRLTTSIIRQIEQVMGKM
jgi:hypothetical protein